MSEQANNQRNTMPVQFTIDGKAYLFRAPRWVENGCYPVRHADVNKRLNGLLVEKWAAEGSGNLQKYCNSNKVGDNYDLAHQCATKLLELSTRGAAGSNLAVLAVAIATDRDALKANKGCAPQLREMVQKAEEILEGTRNGSARGAGSGSGRGADANKARTSLAAAYLDLAELYASDDRKDPAAYGTYMQKAKACLGKIPQSEHKRNVWARFNKLERDYGRW